jgi:tRNA uridine 5-carboxymethylaminomethyl modification enzyme
LNSITVKPIEINNFLKENFTSEITQSQKVIDLISRPQVNLKEINTYLKSKVELTNCIVEDEILESLDIQIKYTGYIEKEKELAGKAKRLEDIVIPKNFDFSKINSLSTEAKIKLKRIMPSSIGQASRISGVSPSDINVLLIFMGR